MNYLAPRQGPFAMIILFCIGMHLLFFVLSQEHKLTQQYQDVLNREVVMLADKLSIAMSNLDQVSISVIAGEYVKSDDVEFVGVYDSKDKLLVPVGQETKGSVSAKAMITLNNSQVLGSVQMQAPQISRAKIISENWLFLAGTFVLYVLIFFVYSYVARPTKSLKRRMTKDIRAELLASGVLQQPSTSTQAATSEVANPKTTNANTPKTQPKQRLEDLPINSELTQNLRVVQICFEDYHRLLETVDHHTKSIYFALCNQLLERATYHLLQQPLLAGVSVVAIEYYNDQKATVVLQADNPDAKVALASVMLARLMMALNHIVYNRHRELKRFCLPVRTLVSCFNNQKAVAEVAKKHRESPLILLPSADLSQVGMYSELGRLSELTTVNERESRYLSGISPAMSERLAQVRDAVLSSK